MRGVVMVMAVAAATAGLAGCGKSGGGSGAGGTAAPVAKTPAQIKAMLASLPAPYTTADVDNGERQFGQCRSCHTVARDGSNMTGPHLWGVVGRKAGSVPDFHYSDGLKASGLTWTPENLDRWIAGPRKVVPDTKMTFLGIQDAKNRRDVIAYLRTQADS
jgi:cytochrome c